jgi:hypothetical protein
MRYPTPETLAAWRTYEQANARAVDQYEAVPLLARTNGRVSKCPKCRCDVAAHGLCRWCRRTT